MSKELTPAQIELSRLQDIGARLRSPDGCPWDREQTPLSLIPYLLEESYEVVEAIEEGDNDSLVSELGDLMLHIVMQAQIAEEEDRFDLSKSIASISDKLVRRHPHVFNRTSTEGEDEGPQDPKSLLAIWEKSKLAEGRESRLDGVPKNLSALIRAQRIQDKASQVGFDWDDIRPAVDKLHEEISELLEAWRKGVREDIEDEMGDVLFSVVNVARLMKLDAETSLRSTVDKFKARFRTLEQVFETEGRDLENASLEEMDKVWDRIKHQVVHRPNKI